LACYRPCLAPDIDKTIEVFIIFIYILMEELNMTIRQDFLSYQESINKEIQIAKDRVRNLIGQKHWQTDGEHKEEIVRSVLRVHLPETTRIGKGFVCFPPSSYNSPANEGSSSGQIDILITSKDAPTLYKQGDLVFVTADAVRAIIEIKTELRTGNGKQSARKVLKKLVDEAERIRKRAGMDKNFWVGLFAYNEGAISYSDLLGAISSAAHGDPNRVVNFVCLGPNTFIRYWKDGKIVNGPQDGPVWHLYDLKNLAATYFINNFVFEISSRIPHDQQRAWFPIRGTKEKRLKEWKSLSLE